jgi:hypothetical protein
VSRSKGTKREEPNGIFLPLEQQWKQKTKGRKRSPNFPPTWRAMEIGDEGEREEPNELFLLPKE